MKTGYTLAQDRICIAEARAGAANLLLESPAHLYLAGCRTGNDLRGAVSSRWYVESTTSKETTHLGTANRYITFPKCPMQESNTGHSQVDVWEPDAALTIGNDQELVGRIKQAHERDLPAVSSACKVECESRTNALTRSESFVWVETYRKSCEHVTETK
jgi:hypothetical protein